MLVMRRVEAKNRISPDSLPSGIEGYAAYMKRYPRLRPEQTEAALFALRNGQSLSELRSHALFAPHLEKEERDLLNNPNVYNASPIRSYRQLFADSPIIGHLVAFGNFPTVLHWVRKFQTAYKGLPLDLEEFMQDALYKIVPEEATSYVPTEGATFTSYLSTMLIWKLSNLVDACVVERSALPRGATKNGLIPKHDRRRMYTESLDAPLPVGNDDGYQSSLYDAVADEHASIPGKSLASSSAIRNLYERAGITLEEAQVLQTSVIEEETQDYAASLYGVTDRTIRGRRDQAVAKFRSLGYETVVSILNGDIEVPAADNGKSTHLEVIKPVSKKRERRDRHEINRPANCLYCGNDLVQPESHGRLRKYCSDRCRTAQARQSQREAMNVMQISA